MKLVLYLLPHLQTVMMEASFVLLFFQQQHQQKQLQQPYLLTLSDLDLFASDKPRRGWRKYHPMM